MNTYYLCTYCPLNLIYLIMFEKHTIYYCHLDLILQTKLLNQNNSSLKMKLILHLIILAALTSFYSISALKCYNCTEKGFDDFCSSTPNSNSWQIIDCDGSCAEQIQLYHRFSRPSKILMHQLLG